MICSKCGGELPAGSKFCPVCGQKTAANICPSCGLELPNGAVFCPVCGAMADTAGANANTVPQSMGYAGMADSAAPSGGSMTAVPPVHNSGVPQPVGASSPVSGVTIPSNSVLNPVSSTFGTSSVLDPVSSTIGAGAQNGGVLNPVSSAMGSNTVPTPTNTVPTPTSTVPTPASTVPSPVNTVPTPSNGNESFGGYGASFGAGGFSNGVSGDTSGVNLSKGYSAPNGGFDFASAAAVAVTPVKKKSPLPFIIGGAAVVAAIAALVGFLNRGAVMNLFMGDSRYAASLEGKSFKNTAEYLNNPAVAGGINSAASTVVSMATVRNNYDTDEDFSQSAPSDAVTSELDTLINEISSSLSTAYDTDGIKMTFDCDINVTDTAMELLFGDSDDAEEFKEIIAAINDTELSMALNRTDDAAAVFAEIRDEGLTINTEAICLSDGSVYVMFPFGSDKAIKYTAKDGAVEAEEITTLDIDEKEVSRLAGEIIDVYLKYYEQAEVTIEKDGELSAAGASAKGKLITAEMDSDLLTDMFEEIETTVAEDAYFIEKITSYASANGLDFTEEDYKEGVGEMFDVELDDEDKLVVRTIVNGKNTVLAKSYEAYDSGDNGSDSTDYDYADSDDNEDEDDNDGEHFAYFTYISGDNMAAAEIGEDDAALFSANINKESETDGVINAKFSDGDSSPFGIRLEYKNAQTVKFRGTNTIAGTYTLSFTPPADFTSGVDKETAQIYSALASSKFIISCEAAGDTLTESITFEMPQYGSVTVNAKTELQDGAGVPAVPGDCIDVTDLARSEELTDEDKATLKELSELFGALRDGIAGADSPLYEPFTELFDEASKSLAAACEPKVDSDKVWELHDRISNAISTLENAKYDYGEFMTDEDSERYEDLYDEVTDLSYGIGYDEMSETEYNEAVSEIERLESEINTLVTDLKNAAASASAAISGESYDFSNMDFDELVDAIIDLEQRLVNVESFYAYEIENSDELYDMYDECCDDYDDMYDDYIKVIDSMYGEGDYSVPLLRELRKSAEKFSESLVKLENAVTDYSV